MCGQDDRRLAASGALPRPQYEAGDELLASDLAVEQSYRRQRLRRHNRYLHGWGVVCGLGVAAGENRRRPWSVYICPGYALGPYGDEIAVAQPTILDVGEALWKHADGPGGPEEAYVVIRASEDARRSEPTRVSDSFEASVLWSLPTIEEPRRTNPCRPLPVACP